MKKSFTLMCCLFFLWLTVGEVLAQKEQQSTVKQNPSETAKPLVHPPANNRPSGEVKPLTKEQKQEPANSGKNKPVTENGIKTKSAEQKRPETAPATRGGKPSQPVSKPKTDIKTKKDGTPDRRFNENKKLKKDGTPDQRFKENKKAK